MPLLTGQGQLHHGEILREAAKLVEAGKLLPSLNEHRFGESDIAAAFAMVETVQIGKVVVEFDKPCF